jgi:nitroreductase
MEAIFERVSVRTYLDIDVEDQSLEKIIRAGMQAPSAVNQRPWEFYVVTRKEVRDALSKCSPYAGPAAKAPVAIVAVARKTHLEVPEMVPMDMSCCVENMLLEAAHLHLGSVWISVAPVPERMAKAKAALGLPDDQEVFAILPVGYPLGEAKQRDRFDATRIHRVD